MQSVTVKEPPFTLWYPGKPNAPNPWWKAYYDPTQIQMRDRLLFADIQPPPNLAARKNVDWSAIDDAAKKPATEKTGASTTAKKSSRTKASATRAKKTSTKKKAVKKAEKTTRKKTVKKAKNTKAKRAAKQKSKRR